MEVKLLARLIEMKEVVWIYLKAQGVEPGSLLVVESAGSPRE